jgi:hypothetical protein
MRKKLPFFFRHKSAISGERIQQNSKRLQVKKSLTNVLLQTLFMRFVATSFLLWEAQPKNALINPPKNWKLLQRLPTQTIL